MENNLPLVSIIMPVYNTEKFIEKALKSILNQTYKNIEILVADDGSLDKSKKILNSFKDARIRFFHNTTNLGYLKTCNKLFTQTKGDFIGFQDADDWSEPDRIEKTMNHLLENKEIAMCGCNFIRLNNKNTGIVSKSNYPTNDKLIKQYITQNKNLPFCGASVILRREVYNKIGGYKFFFDGIGYEHFDWFLRISEKYSVANIPNHLYYYRYIPNSFSRADKLINFKKFHARKIAFYLKNQRLTHGSDGLSDTILKSSFNAFLNKLELDFNTNRKTVYDSLIKNNISNKAYANASKLNLQGYRKKELTFLNYLYYNYRILRSKLAKLIR